MIIIVLDFLSSLLAIIGLIICHLPHGPTAYFTMSDLVMRHDIPNIGNMSEAYPHLIFHNFKSRLGERVSKHSAYKKYHDYFTAFKIRK